MKQVIILSTLVAAATPTATELNSVDPYKKYEMQLDHAHASIAMTKAAIDEVKIMNETAIEDVAKEMEVIKKEAEKVNKLKSIASEELATLKAASKRAIAYVKGVTSADKALNKPKKKRRKKKVATTA